MLQSFGIGLFVFLILEGSPVIAQRNRAALDFLNEKLTIPDSDRFIEADYINSGVGLSFGVDKKLSYETGNHAEAIRRFEDAVGRFEFKSEIWVFLARAYYYLKMPDKTLAVFDRAKLKMPDLDKRLWIPLRQSLLDHISKRAAQLQIQTDFYSGSPEQFLSLFRLYTFLGDTKGFGGVILAIEAKAEGLKIRSETVSASNQSRYLSQSRQWQDLALRLRTELKELNLEAPLVVAKGVSIAELEELELIEETRLLQLRIDFYQAAKKEFQSLFYNYLQLNKIDNANFLMVRLDERIQRLQWLVESTPLGQDKQDYLVEAAEFEKLKEEMALQLEALKPQLQPSVQ